MSPRTDFLSTGLEHLSASEASTDDCGICICSYTSPVKLPCSHIFCEDCICTWLKIKRNNSCPLCKNTLFPRLQNEDPVGAVDEDRRNRVRQALRTTGLSTAEPVGIATYGIQGYTRSDLLRATGNAVGYLGYLANYEIEYYAAQSIDPFERAPITGPVLIDLGQLSAFLVAMGNLIPALAAVSEQPYDDQEKADWTLVLTHLWGVLIDVNGKKFDALILPAKLRQDVTKKLAGIYRDARSISFFFRNAPPVANPRYDDLDLLLNYLTLKCSRVYQDAEREKERRHTGGEKRSCAVM